MNLNELETIEIFNQTTSVRELSAAQHPRQEYRRNKRHFRSATPAARRRPPALAAAPAPSGSLPQGRAARLGAVWTGSAGVVRVQFQRFPRARVAGGPVCAMSRSRLLMRLSGPTPRRVMLPLCLSALRHSRRQRPRGQAGTRIARPAASALPPVSAAEVPPGQTGPQDPLLYKSLQLHHPVNGGDVGAESGTPGLKAEDPADAYPTSH